MCNIRVYYVKGKFCIDYRHSLYQKYISLKTLLEKSSKKNLSKEKSSLFFEYSIEDSLKILS